jgi:sec-independent protein translocase protein TatC
VARAREFGYDHRAMRETEGLVFGHAWMKDQHEKKWAIPFVLSSTVFFVGGAIFGYTIVFPAAFNFLAGYAGRNLELLPSMGEYFTLTIRLLLGFGIAFELPILMVFLGLVGIVDAPMLRRNRKYAILIIFTAAAIITPTPDILNQILMAGPLLLLYELSIFLVWLIARRRRQVDEA